MDIQGNEMASVGIPTNDQHFLLNFIMSNYLGPDVYSDNPRRSASQRLAENLPPYTSKNLGTSFVSISQLESLYYYVLKNAHPSLIVEPEMLRAYLMGNLPLPSLVLLDDYQQFTSFFPSNIHEQKRYSTSNEIIKGIVLIDDPIASYAREKDMEWFKCLSGMDDLKIDKFKSLSYQHEFQKGKKDDWKDCMKNSEERVTRHAPNGHGNGSAMFQETYKRRQRCDEPQISSFSNVLPVLKYHNEEGSLKRTSKKDGRAMMPLLKVPDVDECVLDASINMTGTAKGGITGPPVGVVDIGISKVAYFFRVALPGVRKDYCEFSCEIESNGNVRIQGSTSGGRIIKKRSRVFHMKLQQLCPAGPFSLCFSLPGRVDPRLFSPNFRSDGIFEAVVIRHD
ncbi:hypothetical protein SLEP1_g11227 [Rubroshorea leprosula]|uniref:Increased DNA methylation 3 n=1 Tax=Rubroshorea leprosula TaxID=152421 RepID=A0AAV5IIL1_9ROSI|nr:hypothetical protein SLEP1_g11227 [Rubroshorea leprosula]